MSRKAWAVRTTSYMQDSDIEYAQTEISCHNRAEARAIMAAQKTLAKYAILPTYVELFRMTIVPFDDTRHTIFYTKAR